MAEQRAGPERGAGAHLILVGLPGAGKSTVGRRVADQLDWPFLDFDEEIERRAGLPVAEIFARYSETHFRGLERGITEELRGRAAAVLAPGGGWMAVSGLAALLRPPGRIIYLDVSPSAALANLGRGVARRPLLRGPEPLRALERLLAEREGVYRTADLVLRTEGVDLQDVVSAIARLASPSDAA